MENFIDGLFSWIGFTVVIWLIIVYCMYNRLPTITISPAENNNKTETFAVDLDAYQTSLPTVYSKNCAFDGIKPKGYIPNISDWKKYSGQLP